MRPTYLFSSQPQALNGKTTHELPIWDSPRVRRTNLSNWELPSSPRLWYSLLRLGQELIQPPDATSSPQTKEQSKLTSGSSSNASCKTVRINIYPTVNWLWDTVSLWKRPIASCPWLKNLFRVKGPLLGSTQNNRADTSGNLHHFPFSSNKVQETSNIYCPKIAPLTRVVLLM